MKGIFLTLTSLLIINISKAANDTLEVSFNKTVHIFFESKLKYFDVGSQDVLIDSSAYMIKLKAAVEKFKPTNLTVLTASGIHHYILVFNNSPKTYVHQIPAGGNVSNPTSSTGSPAQSTPTIKASNQPKTNQVTATPVVFKEEKAKEEAEAKRIEDFKGLCEEAIKKSSYTDMGVIDKKTKFLLKGIFVENEHLYFITEVKNESNIKYDIDFIRFVAKNKKSLNTKKYAIQETVLAPEFVLNDEIKTIEPKSTITKVFVFKKFTIAEDKKLFLELWEKGGERQLNFAVEDSEILKAKRLKGQ